MIGHQKLRHRVIAFPSGKLADRAELSDAWERLHRPYGIRDYNSTIDNTAPIHYFNGFPRALEELAMGRTLVFVHGTFSGLTGLRRLPINCLRA